MSYFPASASLYETNPEDLHALREALHDGGLTAFVGAGASHPIYPLWADVQRRLLDEAQNERAISKDEREYLENLSNQKPQLSVTILKELMGPNKYKEILMNSFGAGSKPTQSKRHTLAHEALMRLPFCGYVTTNYDDGLTAARAHVWPNAAMWPILDWQEETGFADWMANVSRKMGTRPIFHLHGVINKPNSIILCETSYAQAYGGRGSELERFAEYLYSQCHLMFIGFGFADPWQDFLFKTYAMRIIPSAMSRPLRHFALIGVDQGDTTVRLRRRVLREVYRIIPIFYPIRVEKSADNKVVRDHSALLDILSWLADDHAPPPSSIRAVDTVSIHLQDGRPALTFSVLQAGSFHVDIQKGGKRRITMAKPFAMAQTVVPQWLYTNFLKAERLPVPSDNENDADYPATGMTWFRAKEFAAWLSRESRRHLRLPSEAEWEYAARAGSDGEFWFNGPPRSQVDIAARDSRVNGLQPVGLGEPNPWGLYHMHGNVHEWVEDSGSDMIRLLPTDGSAVCDDPNHRILKGGSFHDLVAECAANRRRRTSPDLAGDCFGFRLVLDLG